MTMKSSETVETQESAIANPSLDPIIDEKSKEIFNQSQSRGKRKRILRIRMYQTNFVRRQFHKPGCTQ